MENFIEKKIGKCIDVQPTRHRTPRYYYNLFVEAVRKISSKRFQTTDELDRFLEKINAHMNALIQQKDESVILIKNNFLTAHRDCQSSDKNYL